MKSFVTLVRKGKIGAAFVCSQKLSLYSQSWWADWRARRVPCPSFHPCLLRSPWARQMMPSWADNQWRWAWLLHSVRNNDQTVYDTIMTWIQCRLKVYCREASFEAGKTQTRLLFGLVWPLDTFPCVQSLEMALLFCSAGNYISKTSLYNMYIRTYVSTHLSSLTVCFCVGKSYCAHCVHLNMIALYISPNR